MTVTKKPNSSAIYDAFKQFIWENIVNNDRDIDGSCERKVAFFLPDSLSISYWRCITM